MKFNALLLFQDPEEARNIATLLKKDQYALFFSEQLEDAFHHIDEANIDLLIVDVKKMSNQKQLRLMDHPQILEGKIPLVFFYTEKTRPLLLSTEEYITWGLWNGSKLGESEWHRIKGPLSQYFNLKNENILTQKKLQSLQILKEKEDRREKYSQIIIKEICSRFEALSLINTYSEGGFVSKVGRVLELKSEFVSFSMVELSQDGMKIIPIHSSHSKYVALPLVHLGKKFVEGFDGLAQNMAMQTAFESLGSLTVTLFLKGKKTHPDQLLFIKVVDEMFFDYFDWPMLEFYINGFYASHLLRQEKDIFEHRQFDSSFKALNYLDNFIFGSLFNHRHFHNEDEFNAKNWAMVCLYLGPVYSEVVSGTRSRFYFEKFEREFINGINDMWPKAKNRSAFKYLSLGVEVMGFIIPDYQAELFFSELQQFIQKFSYYKYYAKSEELYMKNFVPHIFMSPLSALGILKKCETWRNNSKDIIVGKAYEI